MTVAIVGGSLLTPNTPGAPDPPMVLRNLTAAKYDTQIPAGQKSTVTYTFATDMHPQDVRLNIAAVLQSAEGAVFTKMVFNETVTVVEAPVSIFDPQMYVQSVTFLTLEICVLTSSAQNLPLLLPRSSIRRDDLLHLQHVDHDTIPTEATRRQGWRAS